MTSASLSGGTSAFGLYGHIRANRWRSMLLLAGLFLLVYAVVFAGALAYNAFVHSNWPLAALLRRAFYDLRVAAPVATILVLLWIAIAYWFNARIVDALAGARPIERSDNSRLYDQLETLCIATGMKMPALKIIETDALNAYASGLDEDQYSVTVTRGLIESLDRAEMEAVLAHELTHIRNGDVKLMVIAVIVAGVVSFVGEVLFRWFTDGPVRVGRWSGSRSSGGSSNDSGSNKGGAFAAILIAVAILMAAWALSLVIRFALSRSREYLADAGAVELTKDPDALISALLKVSGRGELPGTPSGIMEMCIDNPRAGFADLFATHPPIETRVEMLMATAGGRLPAWALAGEEPPLPEPEASDALPHPADPASPWARGGA